MRPTKARRHLFVAIRALENAIANNQPHWIAFQQEELRRAIEEQEEGETQPVKVTCPASIEDAQQQISTLFSHLQTALQWMEVYRDLYGNGNGPDGPLGRDIATIREAIEQATQK